MSPTKKSRAAKNLWLLWSAQLLHKSVDRGVRNAVAENLARTFDIP